MVQTKKKYLWEDVPAGTLCFHFHHEELYEIASEPLNQRASFIRENKKKTEVEIAKEDTDK